jgi:hypothetical protein
VINKSECRSEAKWLLAGALAGWIVCCDNMWLAVVATEGAPLSWQQVLWSYWMVPPVTSFLGSVDLQSNVISYLLMWLERDYSILMVKKYVLLFVGRRIITRSDVSPTYNSF